ncbi:MAG TPA: O-antigen ligase domain-containing protein [Verrucomicrobiales bacterium]|nr:O-antigen ligase domain-containing protein [Verrucomicrobiales bacterium]
MSYRKTRHKSRLDPAIIGFLPWMLGIFIAPVWFGGVTHAAQSAIGGLFACSLFLTSRNIRGFEKPFLPKWLTFSVTFFLLLPLIPLPVFILEAINPERIRLQQVFPINSDQNWSFQMSTLSTANTLYRIWQILLIITCFQLARSAAVVRGMPRLLPYLIGTTLLTITCADIVYRLNDQSKILGIWETPFNNAGAGTFINRNHYADWAYLSGLFLLGSLIRSFAPISATERKSDKTNHRSKWGAIYLLICFSGGIGCAVISGSRGGFLAFFVGLAMFAFLLTRHSIKPTRWLILLYITGTIVLLLFSVGDFLWQRIGDTALDTSSYGKWKLWHDSLNLIQKFPVMGIGWGNFMTAFSLYPNQFDTSVPWYAENDYLQMVIESGILGALFLFAFLFRMMQSCLQVSISRLSREPELLIGATAAFTGFLLHAFFEFVSHIMANALLAATMAGFCIGSRDRFKSPNLVPPPTYLQSLSHIGWATMLLGIACLQGIGTYRWYQARQSDTPELTSTQMKQSLDYWPISSNRRIGMTRLEIYSIENRSAENRQSEYKRVLQEIDRNLTLDPFNWELRLERTWLKVFFSKNLKEVEHEIIQTSNINPGQKDIPFRFAEHIATFNPLSAQRILKKAEYRTPENLLKSLKLSWELFADTRLLWDLIPNNFSGRMILGDFALLQKKYAFAADVFWMCAEENPGYLPAEKLLQSKRPDLTLLLLDRMKVSNQNELLKARAFSKSGNNSQALKLIRTLFRKSEYDSLLRIPHSINHPKPELEAMLSQTRTDQLIAVQELAENEFLKKADDRDRRLLDRLCEVDSENLRVQWIRFQTCFDQKDFTAAINYGLNLGPQVLNRTTVGKSLP